MKAKKTNKLSDMEIDQIVVAQADDESAWEEPIHAHKNGPTLLNIPPELAARAAFLARLHRQTSVEQWLTQVIEERVELEEAAFTEAKQDLSRKA
jgi:hypothetical protein